MRGSPTEMRISAGNHKGTAAELLDSRVEGERLKKFSTVIVEESTRLNDILTEFLDFARPQSTSNSYK